jgi:hypothetical protein
MATHISTWQEWKISIQRVANWSGHHQYQTLKYVNAVVPKCWIQNYNEMWNKYFGHCCVEIGIFKSTITVGLVALVFLWDVSFENVYRFHVLIVQGWWTIGTGKDIDQNGWIWVLSVLMWVTRFHTSPPFYGLHCCSYFVCHNWEKCLQGNIILYCIFVYN